VQGARHALEPDHVTAVANIMVDAPSPRRGIFYATCWGIGHAAMLLAVAGPLVVLRLPLPDSFSRVLELAVGVMLVYLGARTFWDARAQARGLTEPPRHKTLLHRGRRPFAVGLMHGLAGSGALAALVAISEPAASTALACLMLYAFGTVFGMIALAAAAGPVLARAGRTPVVASVLLKGSGVISLAVGAVWIAKTLASF
jgi:threonine/homoserine/homoserine lactone efflux protein